MSYICNLKRAIHKVFEYDLLMRVSLGAYPDWCARMNTWIGGSIGLGRVPFTQFILEKNLSWSEYATLSLSISFFNSCLNSSREQLCFIFRNDSNFDVIIGLRKCIFNK